MVPSLSIFILALILVIIRPRPPNEAAAASFGAFIMLAAGMVSPIQALEVLRASANVLSFFTGLMLVSVVADRAGFFEWCAVKAVRLGNGDGRPARGLIFGESIGAWLCRSNKGSQEGSEV